ncbi:LysR family transcriptional regulator [Ramlibacter ginsenosidimutans]|uniref:LysR family transcriptional regulator n=1 Tax=Ramlibacter ginsenosidimutans TaxID=502333 RepID=A0A934TTG2_9BURK|nr:LysR family transcriptional regulator [Ramlibacter ginsenosidimutans]MBK6007229.1 LysR family transcriptional regulator [Ramlibacter ginsenosidimutans]
MKIEMFQTLEAVLRGGSLAAAASEMNLTASAVSMQMKQIEAYLGQPLFDRSGHAIRPTAVAHEVAASMRDGLEHLQSLRRRTAVEVGGIVRLGIIESMLPSLLPGTVTELRARFPRLDLRPMRGRSIGLTDAVKSGDLDAAVVAEPEGGGSARMNWRPLLRSEMRLIVPPDAAETSVPALFKQYDWIRYDRHTTSGMLAARYVSGQVRTRHGALELDSIPAIVAMVSAGLGIALVHLVDAGLCQSYPVRFVRVGRGAPAIQLSLATRKADADSRPLRAVGDAMTSVLANTLRLRNLAGR